MTPDNTVAQAVEPAAAAPPPGVKLTGLPPEEFIDAPWLAELLGVHVKTVRRMAARGELPAAFRFGGRSGWTAGAIIEHRGRLQAKAIESGARRDSKRAALCP
jgi:predicted DNA-binding transcriptional regulator AlpA